MPLLDWLTIAAAFSAEQLVDVPADASAWWAVLGGVGWTLWAVALRRAGSRLPITWPPATRGAAIASIAILAAVPPPALAAIVAWQGLPTACGGEGASPEGQLMACFRGVLIAILAIGTSVSETRFALATTLFMVVLAAIVNDHPATAAINAGYAAVAVAGLTTRAVHRAAGSSLPSRAGLASGLVVAATVALLGGQRDACGRAIVGWLPLSGGDSFAFPWARDGVGDGENLVAAEKNPQATGPVNSGIFVTSHKPSLYDLFNDLYGEPPKPNNQERQRAFGLGPQDIPPSDQHLADSEHAGREFSTVRKPRSASRRPTTDLAARALVTLTGPTPAHLRLAVYDTFDGRTWQEQSLPATTAADCQLQHAGGDWMRWQDAAAPSARAAPDVHAITIGKVRTNMLPLPARADALRIDKIDRADFFRTPAEDVVTLDGIEATAGTTVHAQSVPGGVDGTGAVAVAVPPVHHAVHREEVPSWAAAVLDEWGLGDAPAVGSWPHVARVVAEVGRRIIRDDAASLPDDCPDTLRHALTVSYRGRPYDFAGAAAILLRSCGYTTRLVGGLHVSGDRRDVRSRRLVATADDAHVWAELLDASGRWIPLEPTPGYRLRPPTVPWTTWVCDGLDAVAAWARARAWPIMAACTALALMAAGIWFGWRGCIDAATTAWWRRQLRRGGCPMLATWQLLAWRAWLAGCPKRAHETLREWDRRTLQSTVHADAMRPFLIGFDRAAYGPPATSDDRPHQYRIAAATAAIVTVSRLRSPADGSRFSTREARRWPPS